MLKRLYNNVVELIGNTPLVKINRILEESSAEIYAKLESFNPAGSVKDRIALNMIEDAEAKKAEFVSKARHDSLRRLNQAQEDADKEKEARLKKRMADLEKTRKGIKEKGDSDADRMADKAKDNLHKTESFILKKLEENIME